MNVLFVGILLQCLYATDPLAMVVCPRPLAAEKTFDLTKLTTHCVQTAEKLVSLD